MKPKYVYKMDDSDDMSKDNRTREQFVEHGRLKITLNVPIEVEIDEMRRQAKEAEEEKNRIWREKVKAEEEEKRKQHQLNNQK